MLDYLPNEMIYEIINQIDDEFDFYNFSLININISKICLAYKEYFKKKVGYYNELYMEKFNPRNMLRISTSIIIGKRGSGKTTLINDILPKEGKTYLMNIYNLFDESGYNIDHLDHLYNKPDDLIIALDDCTMSYNNMYISLFILENINKFFIITANSNYNVPPVFFDNIDYIFILEDYFKDWRVRLSNVWSLWYDNYDDFRKLMEECTGNYKMLVLDMKKRKLYWYKVKKII